MNIQDFLRTALWDPLLKFFGLSDRTLADYGTASTLDDVDFPYVATGPHANTMDLIGQWDTAVAFPTQIDDKVEQVNLEVERLPTKDMLWFCVDGDRICVGEMLPDIVVSWEVEPRLPHTVHCEGIPLFEVPADGQKHLVVIAWERGCPVKAYLDDDAVWFLDAKARNVEKEG